MSRSRQLTYNTFYKQPQSESNGISCHWLWKLVYQELAPRKTESHNNTIIRKSLGSTIYKRNRILNYGTLFFHHTGAGLPVLHDIWNILMNSWEGKRLVKVSCLYKSKE